MGRVLNVVLAVFLQVPCHIHRTEGNYDSVRITDLRGETRSSDFPFKKTGVVYAFLGVSSASCKKRAELPVVSEGRLAGCIRQARRKELCAMCP